MGVVKSWMEVGGLLALAEEEEWGLLHEIYPFYLVWLSLKLILSLFFFVF